MPRLAEFGAFLTTDIGTNSPCRARAQGLVSGAFRPSAYQIRYEAEVLVRDSDLVISKVLFAT